MESGTRLSSSKRQAILSRLHAEREARRQAISSKMQTSPSTASRTVQSALSFRDSLHSLGTRLRIAPSPQTNAFIHDETPQPEFRQLTHIYEHYQRLSAPRRSEASKSPRVRGASVPARRRKSTEQLRLERHDQFRR